MVAVAEPSCTKSMGKPDFWCILLIKPSHLCNQGDYTHGVGVNVQLNNSAIF